MISVAAIDTTRYFESPPPRVSKYNDEKYLQIALHLADRCWDHFERTNNTSVTSTIDIPSYENLSGSLYIGGLGPASFLRLHLASCPGLDSFIPTNHHVREEYLTKALHATDICIQKASNIRNSRCTLLESPTIGGLAMKCAILIKLNKRIEAIHAANEIIKIGQSSVITSLRDSECEILYGRAGFLTAILFVRDALDDMSFGTDVAVSIIQTIIENGLEVARRASMSMSHHLPLLWEWHGSYYLGAAHGIVGIVHTLLSFEDYELNLVGEKLGRNLLTLLQETIDVLDKEHTFTTTGNLKSSIGKDKDKLVHWCHGAPGFVMLLIKAYEKFRDKKYLRRAEFLCRNVIYPRGLLKKGVGLCHGISGNAYCFLAVYRIRLLEQQQHDRTDDRTCDSTIEETEHKENETFLSMAREFASFAIDNLNILENVPDRKYSLYEGLGGLSALLIDLQYPEKARFPCFEF